MSEENVNSCRHRVAGAQLACALSFATSASSGLVASVQYIRHSLCKHISSPFSQQVGYEHDGGEESERNIASTWRFNFSATRPRLSTNL